MARVGEEFPLECPNCGGDIRPIAFITEPEPIRKILTQVGESLEPPPVSPAGGPGWPWAGAEARLGHSAAHDTIMPAGRVGSSTSPSSAMSRAW
jgi:hypothetical protein